MIQLMNIEVNNDRLDLIIRKSMQINQIFVAVEKKSIYN